MNEIPLYIDKRTEAEYRRQKNSVLFPLVIFLSGPPIGAIFFILMISLIYYKSNQYVYPPVNIEFALGIVAFSYFLGLVPAITSAVALLIISRRVPASPHLIALSLPVGFGTTVLPLAIIDALNSGWNVSAFEINRLFEVATIGALGAVAALGSVLLALACRCVPSPMISPRAG